MNRAFALSRVFADIGDEISQGINNKLIPSWLSFVVQFGALVVLLIVVFIFAYKPIKKMLNKRAEYIENNIREAEEKNAAAETNKIESQELVLASKKEAAMIIENANNQAEINRENILEETRNDVLKMKKQAEIDIENSKQEALDAIHNEMVDIALSASEEILKREINKDDDARLAEEFVEKLK